MRSQDVLPRFVELVKPYVEAVMGTLPQFEFRTITSTAWLRDMFVFPDTAKELWCIWYDPESVDRLIEDGRYGEVWHVLTHELMHLINLEAKRVALNKAWRDFRLPTCAAEVDHRDPWNDYQHWSEGSAEIGALEISFGLIEQGLSDELIEALFEDKARGELELHVGWTLAQFVIALYRSRRVSELSLRVLNLSFDTNVINRQVEATLSGADSRPQYCHILFMPYALGVSRYAALMQNKGLSVTQLITSPLTDRELRRATV